MKKIALALVALGALTSAAYAEPKEMDNAQMDVITAGTTTRYLSFNTENKFKTEVNSPYTTTNSAAAGAWADAVNPYTIAGIPLIKTDSFTKADSEAVAVFNSGSHAASSSVAVINADRN